MRSNYNNVILAVAVSLVTDTAFYNRRGYGGDMEQAAESRVKTEARQLGKTPTLHSRKLPMGIMSDHV